MRFIPVFLSVFLGAAALPAATVRVLTPSAGQYEKVEIALAPAATPENPFDPNLVKLDAEIALPSGKRVIVPGFWFQEYQRAAGGERVEVLTPGGAAEWRVRFASPETGLHRAVLFLEEKGARREAGRASFTVIAGSRRGFLRISPRNRQYFEDDGGQAFFPIGQNLCMYEGREGTYYFDRLLPKLAAAGANYVRLWQEYYPDKTKQISGPGDGGFSGFPLETQVTGLGKYDLASAWRLDYVAQLCDRLGIRWQIAFEMVTSFERRLRWKFNPYNAERGGPCADPIDYFTNPAARELAKRRLRYSVARWGWMTNLLAWELWNEVDNMDDFNSDACARWHREMGAYLRGVDPWRHLITTSWRDRKTFNVPEIDIVQAHSYCDWQWDSAQYAAIETDHLMRGFGKPFFFGEQGTDGDVKLDPEGKHFHDDLWASTMSGGAGAGMYWWWHNYIEVFDLYHQYTGLAKFAAGVDWPAARWNQVRLSRPNIPVSLNVYGLVAPDRALVWIHDPLAFRILAGKAVKGERQTGASVNIVGLADGKYAVEWWDTSTGQVVRRDQGEVHGMSHTDYGLNLTPPEFWGDIAARIEPQKP